MLKIGNSPKVGVQLGLAALLFAAQSPVSAQGDYEGRIVVEWIEHDGSDRLVRLVEPFTYIDNNGKRWSVPAGALVDGASIPRILWTSVGSPFVGDYRYATVIHDYYCERRIETWQSTHRVFYEAMLVSGVPKIKALKMYTAVRAFGPRWTRVGGAETLPFEVSAPGLSEERLKEIYDRIESEDLSPNEIDALVEASA